MAYDEGLAEILRGDLADEGAISEKRMFGGLVFLHDGNMLCGVHRGGGMFRVGKENEAAALAVAGAAPMAFTRRPMGGFIDASEDLMADEDRRRQVLGLALAFVRALPPK